jgi:hypothetical protein
LTFVGSSGAVCALFGYEISSMCKDLVMFLYNQYSLSNKRTITKGRITISPNTNTSDVATVSLNLFHILSGIAYVHSEYENIGHPIVLDGCPVGHGNHVQGILFGFAVGALTDWLIFPIGRRLYNRHRYM